MLDKLLALIVFIIAFALLICIHEAGHLSMAKLFKVYCKEYSIGFGPKIFSIKKKGQETTFSMRWIPLGGYVSMYGEDSEEDEDFKDIPKERSLEGVKKWKKAIVVSAGVILNAVLAFVLISISNFAFPTISPTRTVSVSDGSVLAEAGLVSGDKLEFTTDVNKMPFKYEYTDSEKVIHADAFYILDNDVLVEEEHYAVTFYFNSNKKPTLVDGLKIYPAISREEVLEKEHNKNTYLKFIEENPEYEYFPDVDRDSPIATDLTLHNVELRIEEKESIKFDLQLISTPKGKTFVNTFKDLGVSFETVKVKISGKDKMHNTFVDYGNASAAVFKGLKVLFTGGIKNMSGIVGILNTSTTYLQNYTLAYYFYFWGLISVNLAIFNLLPFPGLDGWQLLVTAVEGITRKKLPDKFKSIMSILGLVLLFALMIVIVVLDILRIAGF